MTIKKFNNKYLEKIILADGLCYSAKDDFKDKLTLSQHVVFALELKNDNFFKIKDFDSSLSFELSNDKKIKVIEGNVITTSGDKFKNIDLFLKYYEPNSVKVSEFIESYQESVSNKSKQKVSLPKRRR